MQIIFCKSAMSRHHNINVEKLVQRLKKAVGARSVSEIAKSAKIDNSRVSRFLNGDFKKLTPVLRRLCKTLHIPLNEFHQDATSSSLSPDIMKAMQRIVGRNPKKILAARKLLQNLEILAFNGRTRRSNAREA
jgi:transcriptional regulator with XRE-family HTH domain